MGYYADLAHNLQRKNERLKKENEQLKALLTESKKIIKDLLYSEIHYCTGEEFYNIRRRAEIFINNEVEE